MLSRVNGYGIYLAAPPVMCFSACGCFVTYMGQRNELREVIWYENSNILDQIDPVSPIIFDFELLDLSSYTHIAAIDQPDNRAASSVRQSPVTRPVSMISLPLGGTLIHAGVLVALRSGR